MIVQSLRKHWPARKMEWVMAGLSLCWGYYVLNHPDIFTNHQTAPLFAGMAAMVPDGWEPASFWGGLAFWVGMIRGIALYINGAHVRTPVVRVIAAFLTMFVFTQVCQGLWASGLPNPGLVVYPWLVVADMLSAYTAANDAIHAEVQRRIERGHSASRSIRNA